MQERYNSIANALELPFSCTNPLKWSDPPIHLPPNYLPSLLGLLPSPTPPPTFPRPPSIPYPSTYLSSASCRRRSSSSFLSSSFFFQLLTAPSSLQPPQTSISQSSLLYRIKLSISSKIRHPISHPAGQHMRTRGVLSGNDAFTDDCCNASASAMDLPQSCTEPSMCYHLDLLLLLRLLLLLIMLRLLLLLLLIIIILLLLLLIIIMGWMGICFTSVATSWWGDACCLLWCFPTGT